MWRTIGGPRSRRSGRAPEPARTEQASGGHAWTDRLESRDLWPAGKRLTVDVLTADPDAIAFSARGGLSGLRLHAGDWHLRAAGLTWADRERCRSLIVGAGFLGLAAARRLARCPVEVLLIDRNNYHTFLPLLYQVAAAELEPEDIA